jgi:hypothetical protein
VRLGRWSAAGRAVAAVVLAGCAVGSAPDTAARAPGPTGPSRTSAATRTTPPVPASPTLVPSPYPGRCPYTDAETIAGTVGQHIGRTTVTPTQPYPGCSFYRPNGELAVGVAVSVLPSAVQAQARAIAVGGQAANPVVGIGDGGVVRVGGDGAVLAVSQSRALIVVRINQRSSLEAKEIARYVLAGLARVR